MHLPFGMRKELKCSVMAPLIKDCGYLLKWHLFRAHGPTGTRNPHASCLEWKEPSHLVWQSRLLLCTTPPINFGGKWHSLQSTTSALITQKVNVQNLPKPTAVFFQLNRRRTWRKNPNSVKHPSCLKGIPAFLLSAINMNSYKRVVNYPLYNSTNQWSHLSASGW